MDPERKQLLQERHLYQEHYLQQIQKSLTNFSQEFREKNYTPQRDAEISTRETHLRHSLPMFIEHVSEAASELVFSLAKLNLSADFVPHIIDPYLSFLKREFGDQMVLTFVGTLLAVARDESVDHEVIPVCVLLTSIR